MVPAEYVFEDDTCDNVIGSRCPKRDLQTKEEMEAASDSRKDSAKVKEREPEKGGAQPAIRKRRGRPKKSERPMAAKGEPRAREQEAAKAAVEAEALQETGDQLPAVRRGRSRDSGPQRAAGWRTKLLSWPPPIGGVCGLLRTFFISKETPAAERR